MSTQPMLAGLDGAERRRDLSQFYTPAWLASRVWKWSGLDRFSGPLSILEPSCGRGALIAPVFTLPIPCARLTAYDADPRNVEHVERWLQPRPVWPHVEVDIRCGDFLQAVDLPRFDACVMNPPYEGNQDTAFASRALDLSTFVLGIFATRMLHSAGRAEFWAWTDIRRMAVLSDRPRFGGDFSPMTDFVVLDLRRRKSRRKQGEPTTSAVYWWRSTEVV